MMAVVAFLVAVAASGGYSTVKSLVLSQLVGITVARDGRVEETVSGQGFFIRRETVLRSPVTGTVTLRLEEGDRARGGAEVLNISDTRERREAEARVAAMEAELESFTEEHAAEEQALEAVMASSRRSALEAAARLRQACRGGDFTSMDEAALSLSEAVREVAGAEERLAHIREERARLEEALEAARVVLDRAVFPVVAPSPGVVSYCLDGLEDTLTPENVGRYRTAQILTMVGRLERVTDGSRVEAGDPVAKIIADTGVFVAVVVTNSEADTLVGVSEVTLRFAEFEGRREAEARLYHVGEREKSGYCLVTYETSELLDGMVSTRQASATVIIRVHAGTVIPRKALVRRAGQDGVFVVQKGVCRFRPVTVEGGDEDEVVVTGLPVGTPVVTTPWLVDEGTDIGLAPGGRLRAGARAVVPGGSGRSWVQAGGGR